MTELPAPPARRRTARHVAAGFLAGVLVTATVALIAGAGGDGRGPAGAAGASSAQNVTPTVVRSSGVSPQPVTGRPGNRPTGSGPGAGAASAATASGLPVAATASPVTDAPAATAAAALLATLPVKGRAPKTGYSRAQFGETWTDDVTVAGGRNGCDTRNDILRRDLSAVVLKPGSHGCAVLSGLLHDPYSGAVIDFRRGPSTSTLVQIDHLVSLSNAWQTGALQLTQAERTNLANDPDNLQATDGAVNQRKGDGDAATWLPPQKSYRCTYVARQVLIKSRYRLWVTQPERDAILRVLQDCGATTGPSPNTGSTPGTGGPVTVMNPSRPPAGDTVTVTVDGPYYSSCAAARAAGVAPLYVGDPGYRPGLDGDRDGIACETR
jgi:hypothetical protein